MDGLRLTTAPLVPEVKLFLAEDPTILWARLSAGSERAVSPPFWASAWLGGQAVARYVLDNPAVVAGKHVLDLASGSGIVAIAAALAGAGRVVASDVDPGAAVAVRANAQANGVEVESEVADLLDLPPDGAVEVILAGDVLYDDALAPRFLRFLERAAGHAGTVLVGDPGRGRVPWGSWDTVATYEFAGDGVDSLLTGASVITPTNAHAASSP